MAVFLSGQLQILFRFFAFISLASISSGAPAVALEENHLQRRQTTDITVCLPMTSTELIQKLLKNGIPFYSNLEIIPLSLGGTTFTVGVLDETLHLLNHRRLSECVTTYALKELPNRFPRYVLVTECDLSCNNDTDKYPELESQKLTNQYGDDGIAINTLWLEETCDENGKEEWTYLGNDDVVRISQCKLKDVD